MKSLIKELERRKIINSELAALLVKEVNVSKKSEEEVILEEKILPEQKLFEIKSELLKIPLKLEVDPQAIAPEVIRLIPEEAATHYKIVPLALRGNLLEIGMVHPEDISAQEAARFLAKEHNLDYKIYLITPSLFLEVKKRYSSLREQISEALTKLEKEVEKEVKIETVPKVETYAEEAPVSKIVSVILKHAIEGKASDVHIEPIKNKIRVRFRVDGVLYSSLFLPLNVLSAIVARIKILANLKIDETRIPQDGKFSMQAEGRNIDIRVSTFPTTLGEKVALRILDPTMGQKSFEDLGIIGRNKKVLEEAAREPFGTILATGPTGSGKTTTLYAILNVLNKESVNVVTIEDPVEYYIEGVNQSNVKPEIGYTFATALRSILRQDPDIIMVGEIRDEETAALATHAALTGHILLSTLHTTDSVGAIPRLVDMGIKPFLIPATLRAVIAQRLVRKLCQDCKVPLKLDSSLRDFVLNTLKNLSENILKEYGIDLDKGIEIYQPKGCKACNFKGFIGRTGIFEILRMTESLASLIRSSFSLKDLKKEAEKQQMVTMLQDGVLKALKGITSLEEVIRVAGLPEFVDEW